MKKIVALMSVACLTAGVVHAQNLLTNGDFEMDVDGNPGPDGWETWTWGGGWANHEINAKLSSGPYVSPVSGLELNGVYDGTMQMALGGAGDGSGGLYQILPATAGVAYELGVQGGADDWWLPTGELRIFFLDAANAELALHTTTITESIHNPDLYDWGVVYQDWSLSATAPAGTTQIKVEFAETSTTGSVWFDNASLVVVPEPSVAGLLIFGSMLLLGRRFRSRNGAGA